MWDSLGLSGTIRGFIGTMEDPLEPSGTLKLNFRLGWDFEDKKEYIINF